jgi:hypothetical protein
MQAVNIEIAYSQEGMTNNQGKFVTLFQFIVFLNVQKFLCVRAFKEINTNKLHLYARTHVAARTILVATGRQSKTSDRSTIMRIHPSSSNF